MVVFAYIVKFEWNVNLSECTLNIVVFILLQQPTWRLWGEERVEGAVYTVYLKKVRYHTPSRATSSDDEDSISHLEWETVRVRFVKVSYHISYYFTVYKNIY